MAICSVCKIEILEGEEALSMGSHVVHQRCSENLTEQDFQIEELLPPTQEEIDRAELKENSTGSVITDIDLPWERVLWVSFQFLVVGLVLAIPVWILVMILFAITS
tara:strand:+ start:116 stop:433 length:318 start_codon:yes stop_codon:yes gene_type:complete